jgi:hypothetical protein
MTSRTEYTTSIDAAVAVAERLGLSVSQILNEALEGPSGEGIWATGWDPDKPHAPQIAKFVCIAILKATEAVISATQTLPVGQLYFDLAEAANTLERQDAEIKRLREALEEANARIGVMTGRGERCPQCADTKRDCANAIAAMAVDFNRARAALNQKGDEL